MKVTVLGTGGVRTPLLVQSFIARQDRLGLTELALMDIDDRRLGLIAALTAPLEATADLHFKIRRTTDARRALDGADFVITTFRADGIASRAIDERVPLSHGVIGQETTGPGGFAMGMRTIPVLLRYVKLMRELCPEAWLINFANPAGMLAEAVIHHAGWPRAVGICDSPASLHRLVAAVIGVPPDDIYFDYIGLNHLGWVKGVWHAGRDRLPEVIRRLIESGDGTHIPRLPFSPALIESLGMIPNEYLYYYYCNAEAVANILKAGRSRGEQVAELSERLMAELKRLWRQEDFDGMRTAYEAYLRERSGSYFSAETAGPGAHDAGGLDPAVVEAMGGEGYSGVALGLMEALTPASPPDPVRSPPVGLSRNGTPETARGQAARFGRGGVMVLNVPNAGSITGMRPEDVVEVPCWVGAGIIRPLTIGAVPGHCLGLMQQVKEYERLTIEAAVTGSYATALKALTIHPLVPAGKEDAAKKILDGYIAAHGRNFPELK